MANYSLKFGGVLVDDDEDSNSNHSIRLTESDKEYDNQRNTQLVSKILKGRKSSHEKEFFAQLIAAAAATATTSTNSAEIVAIPQLEQRFNSTSFQNLINSNATNMSHLITRNKKVFNESTLTLSDALLSVATTTPSILHQHQLMQSSSASILQNQQHQHNHPYQQQQMLARNSTKTLKCPKCNWHYKYQETLEIHMKEKHFEGEVNCTFCTRNQAHPKLARGESYSCGYKPYRCDLCKYSTTTKGNLSIHMQSDKHLNALNEIPTTHSAFNSSPIFQSANTVCDLTSMQLPKISFANNFSAMQGTLLKQNPAAKDDSSDHENGANKENPILKSINTITQAGSNISFTEANHTSASPLYFQCLICTVFSCENIDELIDHLDIDRNQLLPGYIQIGHGSFQCNLCPYATNLKANFQLHTRTDKHIQRVQLINHMREGNKHSAGFNVPPTSSALCRLAVMKSVVQVRCHLCQETLSCSSSLREHCDSPIHEARLLSCSNPDRLRNKIIQQHSEQQHSEQEQAFENLEQQSNLQEFVSKFDSSAIFAAKSWKPLDAVWPEFVPSLQTFERETKNHAQIECKKTINVDATDAPQLVYKCSRCAFYQTTSSSLAKEHFGSHHDVLQYSTVKSEEDDDIGTNTMQLGSNSEFATFTLETINERYLFSPLFSWRKLNVRLLAMSEAKLICAKCNYFTDHHSDFKSHNCQPIVLKNAENFDSNNDASTSTVNHNLEDESENVDIKIETSANDQYSTYTTKTSNSHNEAFPHKCKLCMISFVSKERLTQHALEHISDCQLAQKCPLGSEKCIDITFNDINAIREHFQKSHPNVLMHELSNNISEDPSIADSNVLEKIITHSQLLAEASTSTNSMDATSTAPRKNKYNVDNNNILNNNKNNENDVPHKKVPNKNADTDAQDLMAQFLQQQFSIDNADVDLESQQEFLINALGVLAQSAQTGNDVDFTYILNTNLKSANEIIAANNSIFEAQQHIQVNSGKELYTRLKSGEFGIDKLVNDFYQHKHTIEKIPYAQLRKLLRVKCSLCSSSSQCVYENIWQLRAHLEEKHNSAKVGNDVIQEIADRLNVILSKIKTSKTNVTSCASAPPIDMLEEKIENGNKSRSWSPCAKRIRSDSTPLLNINFSNNAKNKQNPDDKPPHNDINAHNRKRKNQHTNENANENNDSLAAIMVSAAEVASNNFNFLAAAAAAVAMTQHQNSNIPFSPLSTNSLSTSTSASVLAGQITNSTENISAASSTYDVTSPQKRARTRITDDQLKILRQYFDINNSPSEEQIKEMSLKAQLPEKVIKHWFRNTLFKERQRDKDSPYNFNVPPQMSIDLATYEKTGEAKITAIKQELAAEAEKKAEQLESFSITSSPVDLVKQANLEKAVSETSDTSELSLDEPFTKFNADIKTEESISSQNPIEFEPSHTLMQKEANLSTNEKSSDNDHFANEFFNTINNMANTKAVNNFSSILTSQKQQRTQQHYHQQQQFTADLTSLFSGLASSDVNALSSMFVSAGFPNPFASLPSTSAVTTSTTVNTTVLSSGNNENSGVQSPTTTGSVSCGSATGLTVGGGRRANRTRFTDFQLRTLQIFFDRQAYPKDDDLEMLSKKLGLSPRVIVVWFQNARQKARKINENQPHIGVPASTAAGSIISNDANLSVENHPCNLSSNFQCKRCPLKFSRYFELVQHQRKFCYSNDADAQNNDNNSVEENITDEEKLSEGINAFANPLLSGFLATTASGSNLTLPPELFNAVNATAAAFGNFNSNEIGCETSENGNDASSCLNELWKQLDQSSSTNKNNDSSTKAISKNANLEEKGESEIAHNLFNLITSVKPSSESMLKMLKNREHKRLFCKRCPFCGILFVARDKLLEHMPRKHFAQFKASDVDVDALPNAEDVKMVNTESQLNNLQTHTETCNNAHNSSPLDLSLSGQVENDDATLTHYRSDDNNSAGDAMIDTYEDYAQDSSRTVSTSPNAATTTLSAAAQMSGMFSQFVSQRYPTSSSAVYMSENAMACAAAAAAVANNSKRYRTHLTPLQVYVMKSLFNDYKTPSMSECDTLGREIGLHKRVVQVWFQNARAKERKCRGGLLSSDSASDDGISSGGIPATHCELCSIEFGGKLGAAIAVQDHIFTAAHIERVKERGASMRTSTSNGGNDNCQDGAMEQQTSSARSTNSTRQSSVNPLAPAAGENIETTYSQFPYSLMCGLPSGILPMIYDPNLIGTPIPMLQIPERVMQMISTDLAENRNASRFTQDGLELSHLSSKLSESDFNCATLVESEVGWACTQCSNVFQQENFLRNHQTLICQGCKGTFRLIQIHYECIICKFKVGTQKEFLIHCENSAHKAAVQQLGNVSSCKGRQINGNNTANVSTSIASNNSNVTSSAAL